MKELFEGFVDWVTETLFWPTAALIGGYLAYDWYKGKNSLKGSAIERGFNDNVDFIKSSLNVGETPKKDLGTLTKDVAPPKDVAGGTDVKETSAPVRVAAPRESAAPQVG